jgi:FKBP-type peptidyl-prolyl cis-trans isomerase FklB
MVIQGLSEGIQLMNEGATYRFFIPSQLAYGSEGAGNVIPPYSTLVFQVELISILSYEADAAAEE